MILHNDEPFTFNVAGGLHGGLHGGGPLGHVGPGAIGRSLTPSADMLLLRDSHTAGGGSVAPPSSVSASMFRSSTPGVDFFTSSGPGSRLSGLDHFKLAQVKQLAVPNLITKTRENPGQDRKFHEPNYFTGRKGHIASCVIEFRLES